MFSTALTYLFLKLEIKDLLPYITFGFRWNVNNNLYLLLKFLLKLFTLRTQSVN